MLVTLLIATANPWHKQLKEEFVLPPSLWEQSGMGKAEWREPDGYISSSQEAETEESLYLACFCFYSFRDPSTKDGATHI